MGAVQRLADEVVRKIAAGEVIVRPMNAVKEMVENSLDAGATEITVTVRDGGMTLLQVADNGCGMYKDDLQLACERFATSKLSCIEDLAKMTTFGFRGEALASIAMVAVVNVTSRRKDSPCAFQVQYKDGTMVGKVRAAAGNEGTIVTVEGLFSGSESRRRTLKNTGEESSRILELIAKYGVNRPDVSFMVRRDERGCDLKTIGDGDGRKALGVAYGEEVAKGSISLSLDERSLFFSLTGLMSRPYSIHSAASKDVKRKRQRQFILFINGRPVTCIALKNGVESVLGARGMASTYLLVSLQIDPSRVDVNVHPCKETVFFLQQDDVIVRIQEYLDVVLLDVLDSQSTPSLSNKSNPNFSIPLSRPSQRLPSVNNQSTKENNGGEMKKRCDSKLVRVSGSERRLEEFFLNNHPVAHSQVTMVAIPRSKDKVTITQTATGRHRIFSLVSLNSLRSSILSKASKDLRCLFKSFFFVGCPSPELLLLQYQTRLYSVNLQILIDTLFYQIVIYSFGNLGSYRFSCDLSVCSLLKDALDEDDANIEQLKEGAAFLLSKSDMLYDYFSISFDERMVDGQSTVCLTTIPSLIHGHHPQMAALPEFLLCLLSQVDWDEEESCLEGIARSIAAFYSIHTRWLNGEMYESGKGISKWRNVVRDLIMPKVKERIIPYTEWANNGIIREAADLPQLYKVFERC